MKVKCPNCNADFNPDSNNLTLPISKSNGEYKIYHQEYFACNPCNQIIIGVREYQKYTDIYKDHQRTIDNLRFYRMILLSFIILISITVRQDLNHYYYIRSNQLADSFPLK